MKKLLPLLILLFSCDLFEEDQFEVFCSDPYDRFDEGYFAYECPDRDSYSICYGDEGCWVRLYTDYKMDENGYYRIPVVNNGRFTVRWIDTKDATIFEKELKEGDTWHNPPLQPHQLEAIEPMSSVTEVSTPDSVEDNYRLIPGDSQSLDPETLDD